MEIIQPNREEIIQLLIADMRIRKLLLGLKKAGLSADAFNTELSQLIIKNMGFDLKRDKAIHLWYETAVESMLEQEQPNFKDKERYLAIRIYQMLLGKRFALYAEGRTSIRKAAAEHLLNWFGRQGGN